MGPAGGSNGTISVAGSVRRPCQKKSRKLSSRSSLTSDPFKTAVAPPSRRGFGQNTPEVIRGCCKSAVGKRGAGPRTRNPRSAKAGEVRQFEIITDVRFSRQIGKSPKRSTAMSDKCPRLALHKPPRLESGAGASSDGAYICEALRLAI